MTIGLTQKQSAVLEYVRSHVADKGYPPTVDEIAEHFGWKSRNSAFLHLRALKIKGKITIDRGVSRGISIIGGHGPNAEKMASALRVISAWAKFDVDYDCHKALLPQDVLKLCDEALA